MGKSRVPANNHKHTCRVFRPTRYRQWTIYERYLFLYIIYSPHTHFGVIPREISSIKPRCLPQHKNRIQTSVSWCLKLKHRLSRCVCTNVWPVKIFFLSSMLFQKSQKIVIYIITINSFRRIINLFCNRKEKIQVFRVSVVQENGRILGDVASKFDVAGWNGEKLQECCMRKITR